MKKRWIVAGAVSTLMAGTSFAQEPPPPGAPRIMVNRAPGQAADVMVYSNSSELGGTVQFMSSEMSIEGDVVKGAPYSAEAVTETTQTLGDGNRITRKTSTFIYRDSEGRTRREQSLPAVGPWATSGTPPVNVFINDPVSGTNYVLDSNTKTARKIGMGKFTAGVAGAVPAFHVTADPAAGTTGKMATFSRTTTTTMAVPGPSFTRTESATAPQSKEEKLTPQNIEGVLAEGTRSTITIPAGGVGNERPIDIVSERWYSPELKQVVMTKHSDPRMGETVYKLTGLQRAEPSRSLFDIPSDYALKDDADMLKEQKIMLREKLAAEKKHD